MIEICKLLKQQMFIYRDFQCDNKLPAGYPVGKGLSLKPRSGTMAKGENNALTILGFISHAWEKAGFPAGLGTCICNKYNDQRCNEYKDQRLTECGALDVQQGMIPSS